MAYGPDFIAKNRAQETSSSPFVEIPAIPLDWEDRSLCPVRALRHYVQRAMEFRGNRRLLFIPSARSTSGEIRVDQISRWIKQIVIAAYTAAENDALQGINPRAHEVRAISTSWRVYSPSASVEDLLQAGYWSNRGVFLTTYLRDMCGQAESLYSLGPIVTSQVVVDPSCLLYTSPSPRDRQKSRMPSSA